MRPRLLNPLLQGSLSLMSALFQRCLCLYEHTGTDRLKDSEGTKAWFMSCGSQVMAPCDSCNGAPTLACAHTDLMANGAR